jgi:hypothetical protein
MNNDAVQLVGRCHQSHISPVFTLQFNHPLAHCNNKIYAPGTGHFPALAYRTYVNTLHWGASAAHSDVLNSRWSPRVTINYPTGEPARAANSGKPHAAGSRRRQTPSARQWHGKDMGRTVPGRGCAWAPSACSWLAELQGVQLGGGRGGRQVVGYETRKTTG